MPDADVYQGSRLVAHLDRTARGTLLRFLPGVPLDRGHLSTTLPAGRAEVESPDLHPFFLNLLPEGARLRLLLEASRSKDDALALLMRLGWDTIGDVAFLPHGEPLNQHAASVPHTGLGEVSFWELFNEGIGNRPDAAVPGVQEKISSSTIAFGVRVASVPSAILKLNPKEYPQLVQNEEFFLRMARGCGLEASRATLVHDRDGVPGLLVTRFDRVKEGSTLGKLHQEDACQLLDAVPANKYELSMRHVAEAIAAVATAPVVEVARLMRLYAFSYLIGNGDLHAKNISVLWREAVRLTPAYDVLSTLPYAHLDHRMALALDDKKDRFRPSDFVPFGERLGVPERATRLMLDELCARAEPWILRLDEIGLDAKATSAMRNGISLRLARMRA